MDVSIKKFDVAMQLKNNGIEVDVYDNSTHLGDFIISKGGIEWCSGRTRRGNGKRLTWKQFINLMQSD